MTGVQHILPETATAQTEGLPGKYYIPRTIRYTTYYKVYPVCVAQYIFFCFHLVFHLVKSCQVHILKVSTIAGERISR